jgi:hypothetical protein
MMWARDQLLWTALAVTLLANSFLLASAHFTYNPFTRWQMRVQLAE